MFDARKQVPKMLPHLYNPIHPLPAGFAQQIIDIEMQFEGSKTLTLLNVLLSLYSVSYTQKAIEYYEALNDPKDFQFRDRMKRLLGREDVLALMTGKACGAGGEAAPLPDEERSVSRQFEVPYSLIQPDPEVLKSPPKSVPHLNEGFFSESQMNVSSILKNVQSDIETQNVQLESRLQARKLTKFQSKSSSKPEQSLEYEQELESIIEHFLFEKERKVEEIRLKYEGQIAEIEELVRKSPNSLLQKVVEEMKKAAECEMSSLQAELLQRKHESLAALHNRWLAR